MVYFFSCSLFKQWKSNKLKSVWEEKKSRTFINGSVLWKMKMNKQKKNNQLAQIHTTVLNVWNVCERKWSRDYLKNWSNERPDSSEKKELKLVSLINNIIRTFARIKSKKNTWINRHSFDMHENGFNHNLVLEYMRKWILTKERRERKKSLNQQHNITSEWTWIKK